MRHNPSKALKPKKSSSKVAIIDTPNGERRVSFRSAKELAARFPKGASRAIVGTEIRRKVTVPSSTEYAVVTNMPSREQRRAGYGVGIEGFYRDYDGAIRKIDGEFSGRAISAMIRGRGGMHGLAKGRGAKSLSRKRALELFGAPPVESKTRPGEMLSSMYGGATGPAPRYTRESVSRLAPRRASKSGAHSMRSNPEYHSDSIDIPMGRSNPSRRGKSRRGRRGFPFRKF